MSFSLESYLDQKRLVVDSALHQVFRKGSHCPSALWKSMKYSVFAGGKRLRPILCLASADAVGLPQKEALRVACALELIHTYSLIHDDLPALDDDDYRRGRKTNHKVFGEAMAILAGDGLQTLAFEWISNPTAYRARYRKNLAQTLFELAHYAGYPGMVGGQVDDVLAEKQKPSLSKVFSIHRRKTGALLLSSVRLPALLAGTPRPKLKALTDYGWSAGLAFQIVDDILNETGSRKALGKSTGSDRARGKMTYPVAIGLEKSKEEVERLTRKSIQALGPFGAKGEPLVQLVRYMAQRSN
ncbi:MAG TPA: farnesyl diphosphate synthase [bacterium]|jgi:geranylgeranyl diphosphate synthase type II|nr:farnesyl diphosphate synthase [bacterium]